MPIIIENRINPFMIIFEYKENRLSKEDKETIKEIDNCIMLLSNTKGAYVMYIDEMVKIKNPGKNPKFSQRDREIRTKWCDMKEDGASEEELKNFVKSLTDDEFNVFVKTIGHNPLLPKVIDWRNS